MKSLKETFCALGELPLDDLEAIEVHWEEAMALLPSASFEWLSEPIVTANGVYAGFDECTIKELVQCAKKIESDPCLKAFAWFVHCLAFHFMDVNRPAMAKLPRLEAALGGRWGQFYLLVALSSIHKAQACATEANVPSDIVKATLYDLFLQSSRFRLAHRHLGLSPQSLCWFRHHANGAIYRLGRLQFFVRQFGLPYSVYRHRQTQQTIALAGDGMEFDADGFIVDATTQDGRLPGWTSSFSSDGEWAQGNPISPLGYAESRLIRLPLNEWACRVKHETGVLDMHIPSGGGMTLEACRDSMQQALDFFPRHFPDRPFSPFRCASWIFNTQLEEVLPADSNLVRFMRELYLLPVASTGKAGLEFIFGSDELDLETAPRETSIQRALLKILESGRGLRSGAMIFLPEDLSEFGRQTYRTQWEMQSR